MNAKQTNADITALLRARNTLLWITTREESRVEKSVSESAGNAQYKTRYWDCILGVTEVTVDPRTGEPRTTVVDASAADPGVALAWLRRSKERQVLVMRDLHKWLDPVVTRAIRSLARDLQSVAPAESRAIVVVTPSGEVAPELGDVTVIDYPLPDRAEVSMILDNVLAALSESVRANAVPDGARDRAIDGALGLTGVEIENCYAKSLVSRKMIDPVMVSNEKRRVIARERVLTWHDPDPRGLDSIGGLGVLKVVARGAPRRVHAGRARVRPRRAKRLHARRRARVREEPDRESCGRRVADAAAPPRHGRAA